jgi:hypothetical protein
MVFKIIILSHTNVATMPIYVIPVITARVNTVYSHHDIKTTTPKFTLGIVQDIYVMCTIYMDLT